MAITEELKAEIMHMTFTELVEVLHECADRFMTVKDFKDYSNIPKRTIYDKIDSGELQSIRVFEKLIIHI